MFASAFALTALYGAVGVSAQAATGNNPLNGFISFAASIASEIDPATESASGGSTSATQSSDSSTGSSTFATSSTPTSSSLSSSTSSPSAASSGASTAAATTAPTAAPSGGSGGGLSEHNKVILGVCLALGIILLIFLVLLAIWCLRRRRRRSYEREKIARDGADWEKHGLHRQSADSRVLGTHRNGIETGRFHRHHGHHGYPAATTVGTAMAAQHARHSEASDRGLIAGAHDPEHTRMSGASAPPYHDDYRHSGGGGLNGAGVLAGARHSGGSRVSDAEDSTLVSAQQAHGTHAVPRSSADEGFLKRKPLPAEKDHHNGALLAAGAGAGALAGAAAHKHHHEKQGGDHSRGDYIEDNHGYNDVHRPPHDIATAHHAEPETAAAPIDENRPPTPFGLAAYPSEPRHSSEPLRSSEPRRDRHSENANPFFASLRSGSYQDPSIADHNRQYPLHHTAGSGALGQRHSPPRHSPQRHSPQRHSPQRNSPPGYEYANAGTASDTAYIPYTPSGPYDAASAAAGTPPRHNPYEQIGPRTRGSYGALDPQRPNGTNNGVNNGARPVLNGEVGNGRRSFTRPSLEERRRSSGSAARIPAAARGAMGRDSPRVMASNWTAPGAWQADSSDSSSGRSSGRRRVTSMQHTTVSAGRPSYEGRPSYASYRTASEVPTPYYEIPGAFPGEHEHGPGRRPHGPGMREARNSGGNGSPKSERRLRFSDQNEMIEPVPHGGESPAA